MGPLVTKQLRKSCAFCSYTVRTVANLSVHNLSTSHAGNKNAYNAIANGSIRIHCNVIGPTVRIIFLHWICETVLNELWQFKLFGKKTLTSRVAPCPWKAASQLREAVFHGHGATSDDVFYDAPCGVSGCPDHTYVSAPAFLHYVTDYDNIRSIFCVSLFR